MQLRERKKMLKAGGLFFPQLCVCGQPGRAVRRPQKSITGDLTIVAREKEERQRVKELPTGALWNVPERDTHARTHFQYLRKASLFVRVCVKARERERRNETKPPHKERTSTLHQPSLSLFPPTHAHPHTHTALTVCGGL